MNTTVHHLSEDDEIPPRDTGAAARLAEIPLNQWASTATAQFVSTKAYPVRDDVLEVLALLEASRSAGRACALELTASRVAAEEARMLAAARFAVALPSDEAIEEVVARYFTAGDFGSRIQARAVARDVLDLVRLVQSRSEFGDDWRDVKDGTTVIRQGQAAPALASDLPPLEEPSATVCDSVQVERPGKFAGVRLIPMTPEEIRAAMASSPFSDRDLPLAHWCAGVAAAEAHHSLSLAAQLAAVAPAFIVSPLELSPETIADLNAPMPVSIEPAKEFPIVARWTGAADQAGPRARVWIQFAEGGPEIEFEPFDPMMTTSAGKVTASFATMFAAHGISAESNMGRILRASKLIDHVDLSNEEVIRAVLDFGSLTVSNFLLDSI